VDTQIQNDQLGNDETFAEVNAPPEFEAGTYAATITGVRKRMWEDPKTGETKPLIFIDMAIEADSVFEASIVTSTATGPKSKLGSVLAAALGADGVTPGMALTPKLLIGREVQASVEKKDDNWPKVANVIAPQKTSKKDS
jgi:hypothetical protein